MVSQTIDPSKQNVLTFYQAPTAPKPRSILKKPSSTPLSPIPHKSSHASSSSFATTKADKRLIKHSTFISRITKSQSKPLKRRRPSKKLVTTLASLGDVLGELESEIKQGGGEKGEEGKKSLKSRPGAIKKREKVEKAERERFGGNMALMVESTRNEGPQAQVEGEVAGEVRSTTSRRWAAMQEFIKQTMEQKEEFKKP